MNTVSSNCVDHRRMKSPKIGLSSALLAGILTCLAFPSLAQTVTMRGQPLRFTVPKNVAYSNATTLTITTSGLTTPLVNLAVTGVPGSGNAAAFLSQSGITSNATITVTLIFTNDATLAQGSYDMAVEASGDASYRLPVPVTCSYVWSGAGYLGSSSTNWGSTANWQGGVVPGSTDDVVFRDQGAITNSANSVSGNPNALQTAPVIDTNVVISADATIASLRFGQENVGNTNRAFHVEIKPGATLSVAGPGGLSFFKDTKAPATQLDAKFSGGGKLVVSNSNAKIVYALDAQALGLWDMRALNNFSADVVRLALGDFREFPNYSTNGSSGSGTGVGNFASRFAPQIYLALTNVIKASYVDPNNYSDFGLRQYALILGNNEAQGTTVNLRFSLGLSNAFFLDSLCFGGSGAGGSGNLYNFNVAGSSALFRGIGGLNSRISVWAQGDPVGTITSGSNVRGVGVDFSNGRVDALIDRMYLGRYRTNTTGMTIQGTLTIGGASPGTLFDVNDAILGYQESPNLGTGASAVSGPTGTLNVNSNATFKVNRSLQLGYTTAVGAGVPSYPENCSGLLNINASGAVMASNILAGGVTKLSVNNNIVLNKGNLTVTNGIGAVGAPINALATTNGSSLTLFNVSTTVPTVYVKTFAAPAIGADTLLNLPTLAATYPVTIPLISYVNASPTLAGLAQGTLPLGVRIISIVDNTANKTIDVTLNTGVPNTLVWRGNINNVWDKTTKNWVVLGGSTPTNFVDGDSVVFDDTRTGSASVVISGTVFPGANVGPYGIIVSNTTSAYSFSGGTVGGNVTLQKVGAGSLTVNTSFTPAVQLEGGTLTGSGSVGQTFAGYGSTLAGFVGNISGGLIASNANVTVVGTVDGGLTLLAGNLNNKGTISGVFSISDNATLNNNVGAICNVDTSVPWNIPTNSVLINNGTIAQAGGNPNNAAAGLTVRGSMLGVGKITNLGGTNDSNAIRVTMGAGGTLMIGNGANEITNVTIATRLDFNAASITTFDVDNSGTPVNDKVLLTDGFISGKVNFGVGNNLGGKLVINRTAGPSFNGSTVLYPFDSTLNVPDNGQPAIPQIVPAPAPGLVWDTREVITNLTLKVTTPPFMTNSITVGTNGTISYVFDWPADYRGWRLERLNSALNVGLEPGSTNWTTVFTTLGGTNVLYFPDSTNTPDIYWVRSLQTLSTTNSGAVSPASFFRLAYP